MTTTIERKTRAAVAGAAPCSPSYPEHQKLKAVSHLAQAQGEFVDWLQEQGFVLARYSDKSDMLWPDNTPIRKLLAKYHGIDERKLEAEKLAMLDASRKANDPAQALRPEH